VEKLQCLLPVGCDVNVDWRTYGFERFAHESHVRRVVFHNQYFPISQAVPVIVSVSLESAKS
jgi:hypothetical protein